MGEEHRRYNSRGGFTLVELAIVIVVIALIITSLLIGASLIRTARIQSIASDTNKFLSGISTFIVKYDFVPGDFPNAESYWGSDVNCPDTPTNSDPKIATCNGNGDGKIRTHELVPEQHYEIFRAWQHLSNAGMISGIYTGVSATDPNVAIADHVIGLNCPSSKINGGGYTIAYHSPGGSLPWPGIMGNLIQFGVKAPTNATYMPIITPLESYSIDTKIDDGRPGKGIVSSNNVAIIDPSYDCVTTADPETARYNFSNTDHDCSLAFKTGL